MVVVKNPRISDRTLAILNGETSPAKGILESCSLLAQCNCSFAALPSNTSHYFFEEYQSQTGIYIFDIIGLTINHVKNIGVDAVGLLATTPTVQTKLFEKRFDEEGIRVVIPDAETQEKNVQAAIYGTSVPGGDHKQRLSDGLKAGNKALGLKRVSEAVEKLNSEQGVEVFILGCTEISIISGELTERHPGIQFVDPMRLLAAECVQFYEDVKSRINHMGTNALDPMPDLVQIKREAAVEYVARKYVASKS